MTKVAIFGAAGRMGRRLVALTLEDQQLQLAAALEAPGHELLGRDAGQVAASQEAGVPLTDGLAVDAHVLIEFTVPAGTRTALDLCVQRGVAMVTGTTGLTDADNQAIDAAAATIPVLQAPNMSLGVNVLFDLAGRVAAQLGDDYDIEISETHHRFKKDAPSGTALGIARSVCKATGKDIDADVIYDRHGADVPRKPGQIGMHALRSGDVVGRHTIGFGTPGEELQLTHIATNRDVFVRGALRAAKWLAGKSPGRYSIKDVLGL